MFFPNQHSEVFIIDSMQRCNHKFSLYRQKTGSNSKNGTSRRLPIVIVEHSAELLLTSDTFHLWEKLRRLQEFVLDPLMIAPMAIEQHNTIPPSTKSVRCSIGGTHFSENRSPFMASSQNEAVNFFDTSCRDKKLASVARSRPGCWILCAVLPCSSKPSRT